MRVEVPHQPWAIYCMASCFILVGVGFLRVDLLLVSGGMVIQPWQANLVGIGASVVGIKQFVQAMARYLRNKHRYNRLVAGLCARCGYHLRGNASGRCPECGESIEPLQARAPVDESSLHWLDGF